MRARLTLIAVALAVLAFAGLRPVDRPSAEPPGSTESSSQLSSKPAPDCDLPSLVNGTATASVTVQTLPHSGWCRHLPPAENVSTVARKAPLAPDDISRPLTFPLLI